MIDAHILVHAGTKPEWLDRCLDSFKGEPIVPHVVHNGENIGAGRAVGYTLGTSEYVTYVDSDDYLLPGVGDTCLHALERHRAVVTREWVEYEDGRRHPTPRAGHSLAVYRRCDVLPLLEYLATVKRHGNRLVSLFMKPTQLQYIGYVWGIHGSNTHRLFNKTAFNEEVARCPWFQKLLSS